MRIKLLFSKNDKPVINNQKFVNSYIHGKCLNGYNYHDSPANASISRMCGGLVKGRTIEYPNGGFIVVSSLDYDFLNKLMAGVKRNPDFGFGMKFINIEFVNEKIYDGFNFFLTLETGFMLKKKPHERKNSDDLFYTIDDHNVNEVLKEQTIRKLKKINPKLNFNGFDIQITNSTFNTTRNIYVKNIKNKTNFCQVLVKGNKEIAEHIYHYGLGQSNRSGMGVVFKTENKNQYTFK